MKKKGIWLTENEAKAYFALLKKSGGKSLTKEEAKKTIEEEIVVGFTCGAFDLLHKGHMLMFREAKKQCDKLVVALQEDPSVDRENKNKPVLTWGERLEILSGIRYVDCIVSYKTEKDLEELLKKLKPDVRIIGEDWKGKKFTGKGIKGIKIHFNKRYGDWSSTNIRRRVVQAETERIRKDNFWERIAKW